MQIKAFINNNLQNAFSKGFFHLLIANGLISLFAFGSQFVVAWCLTPVELGQIKIIQTYISFAVLVATFGLNTSVLKLCSESRSAEVKKYIYQTAVHYVALIMFFVLFLLLVFAKLGMISSDKRVALYFCIVLISLFPQCLSTLAYNYLQALKKIKLVSKINVFSRLCSVVLVVILTYFFKFNGYIIAFIAGFFIIYFIQEASVRKLNRGITPEPIKKPFFTHFQYSGYSLASNLVGHLSVYASVFLMNYLISDKTSVGYFSFALTLIVVMSVLEDTISQISVPYISGVASEPQKIKSISNRYLRINVLVISIATIILFFVMPPLVHWVFAGKYDSSIPFFYILLISEAIRGIGAYFSFIIFGIGYIKYNFIAGTISVILNFIIAFLLIRQYGIFGLAYGRLVAFILSFFVTFFFYKIALEKYFKSASIIKKNN